MGRRYESDEERRARNRGAIYHGHNDPPAPMALVSSSADDSEKTPVTEISPIQRRRDTRNLAKGIALGTLAALAGIVVGALLGGCAPVQRPTPKLGASLLFPGSSTSSGGGGTVTQGTAAAGSGAWPVTLTNTADTVVKPGDAVNSAVRVNVVAGGAAGGTSSSFGAAVPGTGTAAGQSDGANMQLPRVFDGDSGAGTQYVSGAVLRKVASGGTVEAGTSTDPLRVDPTGSTVQPVSGTVAATQNGTWTVQPGNTANTTAWKVDGSAVTQPVSGTVTANAGTNLNTSALVLESTFGRAQGSATAGQTGPLLQGAVTTAAPSYTTAQTSPLSLTTGGLLRVDGSGASQPVRGSKTTGVISPTSDNVGALVAVAQTTAVAITDGTQSLVSVDSDTAALRVGGAVAHDVTATAVEPLLAGGYSSAAAPTDVSTDGDAVRAWFLRNGAQAMQLTLGGALASTGSGATGSGVLRVDLTNNGTGIINQGGTWTVQPGNTQNTTEWLTKPTPRTVSSANNTGTCTSVSSSSTTVLASNASRKAYGFKAPSTNGVVVFCKLGATATTSNVPFEAGSAWSQDQGAVYTGVIDCITASSTSSICVYEFN